MIAGNVVVATRTGNLVKVVTAFTLAAGSALPDEGRRAMLAQVKAIKLMVEAGEYAVARTMVTEMRDAMDWNPAEGLDPQTVVSAVDWEKVFNRRCADLIAVLG